jgi:hypothetical protein
MIRRRRPLLRATMLGGLGFASYQAAGLAAQQAAQRHDADTQLRQAVPPAAPRMSERERLDSLARLKDLLDAGVLTREEFDAEKQRILRS